MCGVLLAVAESKLEAETRRVKRLRFKSRTSWYENKFGKLCGRPYSFIHDPGFGN
jgi:hypothetical protein